MHFHPRSALHIKAQPGSYLFTSKFQCRFLFHSCGTALASRKRTADEGAGGESHGGPDRGEDPAGCGKPETTDNPFNIGCLQYRPAREHVCVCVHLKAAEGAMVANRYLHFWAVEGYRREEEAGADRLLTANEAPALRLMCSCGGRVSLCRRSLIRGNYSHHGGK